MSPKLLRRFISGSLALAFVIHTCRAQSATFPTTLTTTTFDRSSSGWFAAPACTATAEGHQTHSGPTPPSLVQHRIQRLGLLHPASFNVRVRTFSPNSGRGASFDRPAVMPTSAEFCFGMNSGAAPSADGAARRRLPMPQLCPPASTRHWCFHGERAPGRLAAWLPEWTISSTATASPPELCCSAGVATASPSGRLPGRRSELTWSC